MHGSRFNIIVETVPVILNLMYTLFIKKDHINNLTIEVFLILIATSNLNHN